MDRELDAFFLDSKASLVLTSELSPKTHARFSIFSLVKMWFPSRFHGSLCYVEAKGISSSSTLGLIKKRTPLVTCSPSKSGNSSKCGPKVRHHIKRLSRPIRGQFHVKSATSCSEKRVQKNDERLQVFSIVKSSRTPWKIPWYYSSNFWGREEMITYTGKRGTDGRPFLDNDQISVKMVWIVVESEHIT